MEKKAIISEYNNPPINTRKFSIKFNTDNEPAFHTTLTSDSSAVDAWISSALRSNENAVNNHNLIFGIGIQESPYIGEIPVATIQLCIRKQCLIFHLHHAQNSPQSLRYLLSNPYHTFVGLYTNDYYENIDDERIRKKHSINLVPQMPIDLRFHVHDARGIIMKNCTVREIAKRVLDVDIVDLEADNPVIISDWEAQRLSLDQICYASLVAFVSFNIGLRYHAYRFNKYLGLLLQQQPQ